MRKVPTIETENQGDMPLAFLDVADGIRLPHIVLTARSPASIHKPQSAC